MNEEEFEQMNCKFSYEDKTATNGRSEKTIDKSMFKEIDFEEHTCIFKLATHDAIKSNTQSKKQPLVSKEQVQDCSIRYQVLSKDVSMVGVKKNRDQIVAEPE